MQRVFENRGTVIVLNHSRTPSSDIRRMRGISISMYLSMFYDNWPLLCFINASRKYTHQISNRLMSKRSFPRGFYVLSFIADS